MKSPLNFPFIYWYAKFLFHYHDWAVRKLEKLDMKDNQVFQKTLYHYRRAKTCVLIMDSILDMKALELGINRDKMES